MEDRTRTAPAATDAPKPGARGSLARLWARHGALIVGIWAFGFFAFLYGYAVGDRHWFPFGILEDARVAAYMVREKLTAIRVPEIGAWTDLSPADAPKHWVIPVQPVNDGADLLLTGGEAQYLHICPEDGCTAVILRRDGTLVHAYPYRPDELLTKRTVDLPYQEMFHDNRKDTTVFGLAPLPNGDLIVVYDFEGTLPRGGGISRIDKNGHVIWYRRDYSSHWPKITSDGEILDIGKEIMAPVVNVRIARQHVITFSCDSILSGVPGDTIQVLDLDGHVKDTIPLFKALAASPYRSYLAVSVTTATAERDPCDPLHTNSVNLVGDELAAKLGVQPDDLLVSLRNLSALVIVGRHDHQIKRLFKGTFLLQHSAQVMPGGKIAIFDNMGASADGGPSRFLIYDPATGGERTLFPSRQNHAGGPIFSAVKGNINISQDGTRALVAFTERGQAFEVRLDDGTVLTRFENVHDVHMLPEFAHEPKQVRYFAQHGVYYVSPTLTN